MKVKTSIFVAVAIASISAQAQNIVSWEYNNGNMIPSNGVSYAGVVLAPYWNNSREEGVANLVANDGSLSGISLTFADAYGAWGIGGVSGPDANGTYNKSIFDGYGNTASTDTLGLSGISFSLYNVIVYFSSDTDGRTGSISDGTTTYDFSTIMRNQVNNDPNVTFIQTTDTTGANPGANYAVFSDLSGSSQTFTLATAAGMGIAGVQITPVPEPGTLALAGLGGLGLLSRRRMFKS
jgi:hypothetical protein